MAERVEGVVGSIDRAMEGEIGHIGHEQFVRTGCSADLSPGILEHCLVEVKAGHLIAALGQFDHQPPAAASWLKESTDRKIAILSAGGFDEVCLRLRLIAESEIKPGGVVVPVGGHADQATLRSSSAGCFASLPSADSTCS